MRSLEEFETACRMLEHEFQSPDTTVGIGGGAPTEESDIRLGDVVVSVPRGQLGGVQYGFRKRLASSHFRRTGQLDFPPQVLLGAIPDMKRRHRNPRMIDGVAQHLKLMDDMPDYKRPDQDRLYHADYEHKNGRTCDNCETDGIVQRPERKTNRKVTVHYGIIASANSVMKNAIERDQYAKDPELNALRFEMKAGGLMNNFPCLHKYAAELLNVLKPTRVAGMPSWAGGWEIVKDNRILNWLTPIDYAPQQNDYISRQADRQTLFCPGIPGAGKTILSSIFIKGLITRFKDSTNVGIVYLYCSFQWHDEQKAENLLAISDCCRSKFLLEVFSLQAKSRINFFATSRPIIDIEDKFEEYPSCEILASDEDVRKYLNSHMLQLRGFVLKQLGLQEEIKARIAGAVEGMYPNGGGSAVDKKFAALTQAYTHAMERINAQKPGLRRLANNFLSWIICAKRPLTTPELQDALAVKIGVRNFDKANLREVDDMVSVCAGLVTVDKKSKIIRLVHCTTQEYFKKTQKHWFPNAESLITAICVTYLSFDIFESGFCATDEKFMERLSSNRLYDYAARNWGHHGPILELLENVMGAPIEHGHTPDLKDSNGQSPLSWAAEKGHEAVVSLLLDKGEVDVNPKEKRCGRTPLACAGDNGNGAMFRYTAVVELLVAKGADVDSKNYWDQTPLTCSREWALSNSEDKYGQTPLSCVVVSGHLTVVELLLTGGVDVGSGGGCGQTLLMCAAKGQHLTIVELLLAKGTDAGSDDGYVRSFLRSFPYSRHGSKEW
ncbi:hypothetical protein AOQ84DRAFT_434922 [Glonium stellatum]|uniref:Ankyrin repeat protein n=1 Tax=Glonium stellatum TaxID=574774 RepID=A0A8E2EME6_9PEZI|nr:hypothetical protein AOQ84DRAFT_434922 [Glonium stellatum]